ncbi:hypothetical protein FPZ12_024585 [Amycolatopsis acidicola]|uniref:Uncharacterized protein n=1 Tax=Amycolatopsis acidicola TaxID=2596893 RepID=A0A5N0V2I3_9PSEU|nr:hypothetical protein [Amycolatopsis acidicola]KAA9157581.1 hypothetical protein FPZ12_024585 [Amycolatopsis acidicola]
MAERVRRRDQHAAVERDVLVRYLDAWLAGALRSHRRATYVEGGELGADAFRVFEEFADRIEGHHLEMVVVGSPELGEPPEGLSVRRVDTPTGLTVDGPMLAHLDMLDALSLTKGKAHEVVFTLPEAGDRQRLGEVGLAYRVAVELVADGGETELLVFATGDSKHLATFKRELWSVDEFAGIRYRDPADTERTLIDISLTPQLLPLRRALSAELARRGSRTVAELQRHTLLETIYRAEDTIGALNSAATAGEITREPEKGRLTPRTVVSPARR